MQKYYKLAGGFLFGQCEEAVVNLGSQGSEKIINVLFQQKLNHNHKSD